MKGIHDSYCHYSLYIYAFKNHSPIIFSYSQPFSRGPIDVMGILKKEHRVSGCFVSNQGVSETYLSNRAVTMATGYPPSLPGSHLPLTTLPHLLENSTLAIMPYHASNYKITLCSFQSPQIPSGKALLHLIVLSPSHQNKDQLS